MQGPSQLDPSDPPPVQALWVQIFFNPVNFRVPPPPPTPTFLFFDLPPPLNFGPPHFSNFYFLTPPLNIYALDIYALYCLGQIN